MKPYSRLVLSLVVLQIGCLDKSPVVEAPSLPEMTPAVYPDGVPQGALLSYDESRYAYTQTAEGRRDLFVQQVGDGTVLDLTSELTASGEIKSLGRDLSWSADGTRLAFSADGGLWVVAVEAGARPRRVTPPEVSASSPTLSPDGTSLAFVSDEGEHQNLWTVDVETGERRPLTDHDDFVWRPRWSPDGKTIAFYSTWNQEMTDVHTVDVETGTITRITSSPAEEFFPAWSPDGQVLFAARRESSRTTIWAHDLETGAERPLTDGILVLPLEATSRRLFLRRWHPDQHLFRVPAAGGDTVQVTSGEWAYADPVASPTADVLAVVTDGAGPEDRIVLMSPSGERLATLSDGWSLHRNPTFSPDGEWITYQHSSGGWRDTNEIWLARADGSLPRALTAAGYLVSALWCGGDDALVISGRTDGFGQVKLWRSRVGSGDLELLLEKPHDLMASDCSPNGRRVVFTDYGEDGPRTSTLDLRSGEVAPVVTALATAEGLRYSPDGTQFAFVSHDNEARRAEIYVQAVGSSDARRLTSSSPRKSWPSWSRDGQTIWFSGDRSTSEILVMDLTGLHR